PLLLAPGTRVSSNGHGRSYDIGLVLGFGGFGITYLARELARNERLAIKEYLPRDQAGRANNSTFVRPHTTESAAVFEQGLSRFLREAEVLKGFHHPNIVSVLDVFRANNTAYLVMPYYHGRTLREHLNAHGRLEPRVAVSVMSSVLDGLRQVHDRDVNGK